MGQGGVSMVARAAGGGRRDARRGWVSVGIDHDTAEFAANAIRLLRL
jgi:hypothetical protein